MEAESGFTLATQPALDFQAAILGGRWSEAISLLPQMGIPLPSPSTGNPISTVPEEPPLSSSASSMISMKSKYIPANQGTPAESIKFLISQQKYLEMLEVGAQKKALAVLRIELAPVAKDSEALHTLSG